MGSESRAKKIIKEIFSLNGHRLSYEFSTIAVLEGNIIGMILTFPGKDIGRLSWQLDKLLLKQYNWHGKMVLINRGLPLVFMKEADHDTFFLNNIAVRKPHRGHGIGKKLLLHVEKEAKDKGFSKLGLVVHIDNHDARRFYDRNGYKVISINLESNRRIPYLGSGYQRRVKNLKESFPLT